MVGVDLGFNRVGGLHFDCLRMLIALAPCSDVPDLFVSNYQRKTEVSGFYVEQQTCIMNCSPLVLAIHQSYCICHWETLIMLPWGRYKLHWCSGHIYLPIGIFVRAVGLGTRGRSGCFW